MYDKEKIFKRFEELKASGKSFNLKDLLVDKEGNVIAELPKSQSIKNELNDVNDNHIKTLTPYHKRAFKCNMRQINNNEVEIHVGGIHLVNTEEGKCMGFFIKNNIIFYHEDSLTVLIQHEDKEINEISLYEIDKLFAN
jgi:hypothetical protein